MKTTRPCAKAINKPLQIAGVDMRLVGIGMTIAGVASSANDGLLYKCFCAALFFAVCYGARLAGRKDPNLLPVWNAARRHRWIYDPAKRAFFRLIYTHKSESF